MCDTYINCRCNCRRCFWACFVLSLVMSLLPAAGCQTGPLVLQQLGCMRIGNTLTFRKRLKCVRSTFSAAGGQCPSAGWASNCFAVGQVTSIQYRTSTTHQASRRGIKLGIRMRKSSPAARTSVIAPSTRWALPGGPILLLLMSHLERCCCSLKAALSN